MYWFQLTSKGDTQDELDFEFLGAREGKPIQIQTNVFINGQGNREQKFVLWFDPSADFHTYGILWNPYQIAYVFFSFHVFYLYLFNFITRLSNVCPTILNRRNKNTYTTKFQYTESRKSTISFLLRGIGVYNQTKTYNSLHNHFP